MLVTVVVALFLVAAIAVLLNHDSAISANTSSAELETARAEYIARAGMQHALWRAANNACMGEVAIPATTLGQDSYVATITGAAAGTTYILNPDQDAWIRSDDVTKNNGTNADQHIRFDGGAIEHSLTRFDLSSLPPDAPINSAVAWFYVSTGGANGGIHPEGPLTVHAVLADWTETGATWDTMGGNFDSSVLAAIPAQDQSGVWVSFNLTGQVQAWVNGQPNHGILMASTAEGVHGKYSSREDGSNAPRLEVTVGSGPASPLTINATGTLDNGVTRTLQYDQTPAYQPPTFAIFQPGVDGKDGGVRASQITNNYGAAGEIRISGGASPEHFLIQFPVERIPRGSRVVSARMELYLNWLSSADPAAEFSVHRMTQPWTEGTGDNWDPGDGANWNTSDGSQSWDWQTNHQTSIVADTTVVDPSFTGWHAWDVSDLAQQWVTGEIPNHGMLIKGNANAVNGWFRSSDFADPSQHPRLIVEYACECGRPCMAPQGSGKILMVTGNHPSSLSAAEEEIRNYLEGWGYTVHPIDDNTSQSEFDIELADHDVVFVSETVTGASVGTKLTAAPIGVVNAERNLNDELGLSSSSDNPTSQTVDVVDNSHYITNVFSTGTLQFKTYASELASVGGSLAPGARELAYIGGVGALVTLDKGATTSTGGTAVGRRALLPVGEGNTSWDYLTNSGRLLVQRSLDWAMGVDVTNAGNLLMVVVNPSNLTAQEQAKRSLIESWGYTVNLVDESDSQATFNTATSVNDVVFVTEDVTASNVNTKLTAATIGVVTEEVNLADDLGMAGAINWGSGTSFDIVDNSHYITSPFATGTLTVLSTSESLAIIDSNPAPDLDALALKDGDPSLYSLDAGATTNSGGSAAGRRVVLPWGGNNMDVNHLNTDGLTIFKRALEWGANVSSGGENILLVVGDPASLTAEQAAKKSLMEGWGHTVTLIATSEDQAAFDAATAGADVVYVPELGTTPMNELGTKADNLTKGVITEEARRTLMLGSFSLLPFVDTDSINITDNAHYITETLPIGNVQLSTAVQSMWVLKGTLAVDLHVLGEMSGTEPGLAYLDVGELRNDSTPAPGRRVKLPWGSYNFDVNMLTADGLEIMKRAIQWGAAGGQFYLDEFPDFTCDGPDEYIGSNGSLDWSGFAWTEIGDDGRACGADFRAMDDPLIADPTGNRLRLKNKNRTIHRLVDLSGFSEAYLSFNYRRDSMTGAAAFNVEVSGDGGGSWTTLETITAGDDSAYQASSHNISSYIAADSAIRFAVNGSFSGAAYIDDVKIATEGDSSGGGGGGSPGYNEAYTEWFASNDDAWETVDLGAHGVPADAVAEVAVINKDTGKQYWGGVRQIGSGLERRFQLHEAEGNGVDAVTMHVQVNSSGQIQHYSDKKDKVTFVLLGFWVGPSYVEKFDAFSASGSGSWREHDFSAQNVGPNQVAEIAIVNTNTGAERFGGLRPSGSSMQRRFDIHEAESGGVDALTLMVETDASAIAEVYAESTGDIDFYVLGYWSDPPGTYTEHGGQHGQVSTLLTWEEHDLSTFGIPPGSVAQFVVVNESTGAEVHVGVRQVGSSHDRILDIQEAESGGSDTAVMHVNVNDSARVEWYAEYGSGLRFFYPVGWWVLD